MVAFFILAVLAVAGALGMVFFREPVYAALSLVAVLLTMAVIYVTLDAHFLAAVQVIVYTGAIMVLFLFVIMLLNVSSGGEARRFRWLPAGVFLAAVLTLTVIIITALYEPQQLPSIELVADALGGGAPARIGEIMFTEYVLAFQLVGVLLLTGVVGAVSLVQRKATTVDGGES